MSLRRREYTTASSSTPWLYKLITLTGLGAYCQRDDAVASAAAAAAQADAPPSDAVCIVVLPSTDVAVQMRLLRPGAFARPHEPRTRCAITTPYYPTARTRAH